MPITESPHSESKPRSHLGAALMSFIDDILGLYSVLPIFMSTISHSRAFAIKQYNDFLEKNGTLLKADDSIHTYAISPQHIFESDRLERALKQLLSCYKLTPRSFVVLLMSQYEDLISQILKSIYSIVPSLLDNSEMQLKYSDLVMMTSLDEARDYTLDKEIDIVLAKTHAEQLEWLTKHFKVNFDIQSDLYTTFIEASERRNLFVHCNGIINRRYINNCQKHEVPNLSALSIGNELKVDPKYFNSTFECLFELAARVVHILWRKLVPDDNDYSDRNINNIGYMLIDNGHYELATRIIKFSLGASFKCSPDIDKKMRFINLAQAYKWAGDEKQCYETLNSHDWTASDHRFQLALAALRNEYERGANIMRQIGANGLIVEEEYAEWPLFRDFRTSQEFKCAFNEIFGHEMRVNKPAVETASKDYAEDEHQLPEILSQFPIRTSNRAKRRRKKRG